MARKTYMWDIPLFIMQGYATLDGGEFNSREHGGVLKLLSKDADFRRFGLKSDAPSWIQDEYESWVKYREELEQAVT